MSKDIIDFLKMNDNSSWLSDVSLNPTDLFAFEQQAHILDVLMGVCDHGTIAVVNVWYVYLGCTSGAMWSQKPTSSSASTLNEESVGAARTLMCLKLWGTCVS